MMELSMTAWLSNAELAAENPGVPVKLAGRAGICLL